MTEIIGDSNKDKARDRDQDRDRDRRLNVLMSLEKLLFEQNVLVGVVRL